MKVKDGWFELFTLFPFLVVVIVSFGSLPPAAAQFPPGTTKSKEKKDIQVASEAYAEHTFKVTERILEIILPKFHSVLPSEHQYLVSKDRISVEAFSDFNAFTDYEHKRIIIPLRLTIEADAQTRALLMVRRKPSLRPKYDAYVRYLADRSYAALLKVFNKETTTDDILMLQFAMFADEPPATLTNVEMQFYDKFMIDGLALVVAHELGHLVGGHSRYNKISPLESIEQEYEADRFAAKLMKDTGFSVLPGVVIFFVRFGLLEELTKGIPDAKTHPSARCRAYYLAKNEMLELAAKLPERRKEFERNTGTTINDFQKSINVLGKNCSP